jgi:folylpolyglutamate synthase/dihydropteroate synthase
MVSARQRAAAARVIEARCQELGALLEIVPPLRAGRSRSSGERELSVPISTGEVVSATLGLVRPGQRPAAHQRQNAAVGVAAAEALRRHGLPLDVASVQRGLAEAWLPARQEIVSEGPLIVVDAAHNVDSARALAATLGQMAAGPIWLVLGMLGDKDAGAVARILAKHAVGAIAAMPASPRGLPAADLARAWRAVTEVPVEEAPSVAVAVERARERAGAEGAVVVAGSFVTAAEARTALGLQDVLTYDDHMAWLGRMSRAES